jgi:hypothetical protein
MMGDTWEEEFISIDTAAATFPVRWSLGDCCQPGLIGRSSRVTIVAHSPAPNEHEEVWQHIILVGLS